MLVKKNSLYNSYKKMNFNHSTCMYKLLLTRRFSLSKSNYAHSFYRTRVFIERKGLYKRVIRQKNSSKLSRNNKKIPTLVNSTVYVYSRGRKKAGNTNTKQKNDRNTGQLSLVKKALVDGLISRHKINCIDKRKYGIHKKYFAIKRTKSLRIHRGFMRNLSVWRRTISGKFHPFITPDKFDHFKYNLLFKPLNSYKKTSSIHFINSSQGKSILKQDSNWENQLYFPINSNKLMFFGFFTPVEYEKMLSPSYKENFNSISDRIINTPNGPLISIPQDFMMRLYIPKNLSLVERLNDSSIIDNSELFSKNSINYKRLVLSNENSVQNLITSHTLSLETDLLFPHLNTSIRRELVQIILKNYTNNDFLIKLSKLFVRRDLSILELFIPRNNDLFSKVLTNSEQDKKTFYIILHHLSCIAIRSSKWNEAAKLIKYSWEFPKYLNPNEESIKPSYISSLSLLQKYLSLITKSYKKSKPQNQINNKIFRQTTQLMKSFCITFNLTRIPLEIIPAYATSLASLGYISESLLLLNGYTKNKEFNARGEFFPDVNSYSYLVQKFDENMKRSFKSFKKSMMNRKKNNQLHILYAERRFYVEFMQRMSILSPYLQSDLITPSTYNILIQYATKQDEIFLLFNRVISSKNFSIEYKKQFIQYSFKQTVKSLLNMARGKNTWEIISDDRVNNSKISSSDVLVLLTNIQNILYQTEALYDGVPQWNLREYVLEAASILGSSSLMRKILLEFPLNYKMSSNTLFNMCKSCPQTGNNDYPSIDVHLRTKLLSFDRGNSVFSLNTKDTIDKATIEHLRILYLDMIRSNDFLRCLGPLSLQENNSNLNVYYQYILALGRCAALEDIKKLWFILDKNIDHQKVRDDLKFISKASLAVAVIRALSIINSPHSMMYAHEIVNSSWMLTNQWKDKSVNYYAPLVTRNFINAFKNSSSIEFVIDLLAENLKKIDTVKSYKGYKPSSSKSSCILFDMNTTVAKREEVKRFIESFFGKKIQVPALNELIELAMHTDTENSLVVLEKYFGSFKKNIEDNKIDSVKHLKPSINEDTSSNKESINYG